MARQMYNYPIEPEVKALLDKYAKESGISMWRIIGFAITEYVAKHSKGKGS